MLGLFTIYTFNRLGLAWNTGNNPQQCGAKTKPKCYKYTPILLFA